MGRCSLAGSRRDEPRGELKWKAVYFSLFSRRPGLGLNSPSPDCTEYPELGGSRVEVKHITYERYSHRSGRSVDPLSFGTSPILSIGDVVFFGWDPRLVSCFMASTWLVQLSEPQSMGSDDCFKVKPFNYLMVNSIGLTICPMAMLLLFDWSRS